MTSTQNLPMSLLSFQILDSKSGNILKPSSRKEGNEVEFEYDIHENHVEVKITSTTFCKTFYYQLVSKSRYQFDNTQTDAVTYITSMADYSFKRHSNIFRQFNYTGVFKNCLLENKSFDELYSITHNTLTSGAGSILNLRETSSIRQN